MQSHLMQLVPTFEWGPGESSRNNPGYKTCIVVLHACSPSLTFVVQADCVSLFDPRPPPVFDEV
jgi:hypothetical protein